MIKHMNQNKVIKKDCLVHLNFLGNVLQCTATCKEVLRDICQTGLFPVSHWPTLFH